MSATIAPNEAFRKAYFQPFEDDGKDCCGAPRRQCSGCGFKFKSSDPGVSYRMHLSCPECGHDRRCRKPPRVGHKRCQRHNAGGLPKVYKQHVGIGDALPPTVREKYEKALKSIDLTNVLDEYALVRTRMNILAERLSGSESDGWWLEAQKVQKDINSNLPNARKGDQAAQTRVMAKLGDLLELIEKGAAERDQWDELLQLNQRSAELKDKQSAIEHRRKAYLTGSEALGLMTNLAAAMRMALVHIRGVWLEIADLAERHQSSALSDEIAARVAKGEDVKEAAHAVIQGFLVKLNPRRLQTSINEADDIVQTRVVELLEGPK